MADHSEDKKSKNTERNSSFWAQVFSLIGPDVRELLNIVLFAATIPAIGYGGLLLYKYLMNLSTPTAQCWDLKEASGTLYRLNTCTGELIKVDPQPSATTAPQARQKS